MAKRVHKKIILGIAVCCGLVSALVVAGVVTGSSGQSASKWRKQLVGRVVDVDRPTQDAADYSNVSASEIHEILSTTGDRHEDLVASHDSNGSICVSARRLAGSQTLGVQEFICLTSQLTQPAVLFQLSSGPTLKTIARSTILGVAASSVRRVVVDTKSGSRVLPLNQSQAFSYVATMAAQMPTGLRVLDSGGGQLASWPIDTSPPE